ncbi:hypothetical protein FA10DRAFT_124887 [Acaromyces ingoldii]|uniref:Uncharacterized protein n=1 Tax=Acaromyces ingoldii TaxID=215250 RepID=A0A316YNH2_9BASI|nr:hypothetical protein FA10DRAFT_124887 [Acaromyces ingoldii]PWN90819.1 hypothetical protein FA10DRAFT_124887 [Acaromyces ingoldii]
MFQQTNISASAEDRISYSKQSNRDQGNRSEGGGDCESLLGAPRDCSSTWAVVVVDGQGGVAIDGHDARPSALADRRWPAPFDLARVGRSAEDGLYGRALCQRVLVGTADDDERAVLVGCNLRRARVLARRGRVYLVPVDPRRTVVVRQSCFHREAPVACRLKDEDEAFAVAVAGAGDACHAVSETLVPALAAPGLGPGCPSVFRDNEHRVLLVLVVLVRVQQLHLASLSQPHEWLPDAKWRGLFGRLRGKVPRLCSVERMADRDAVVRAALVVVPKGRQDAGRLLAITARHLQKEEVVDIALSPRHLGEVVERLAIVCALGDAEDPFGSIEAREARKDRPVGQPGQARIGPGHFAIRQGPLIVVDLAFA